MQSSITLLIINLKSKTQLCSRGPHVQVLLSIYNRLSPAQLFHASPSPQGGKNTNLVVSVNRAGRQGTKVTASEWRTRSNRLAVDIGDTEPRELLALVDGDNGEWWCRLSDEAPADVSLGVICASLAVPALSGTVGN